MTMLPLEIPPGMSRNGTDLMAMGRWADGNLVRFHEGSVRPVGGWRSFKETVNTGYGGVAYGAGTYGTDRPDAQNAPARGMLGWRDNEGLRWIAIGSSDALRVLETDGTLSTITPEGFSEGSESATINTGYGGDLYSAGTYGTPRSDASTYTEASVWHLDTWGEYLVGCCKADGRLYEWRLDPDELADQIANSPINCEGLVATEERFLFALGAGGNPRKIQWCDQEDNTTWTPDATNQAGDIELQTLGGIMQGVRTRGQTLILTDVDAHTATFIGGNTVYGFERVGDACGAASRMACTVADGTAYWMGLRGFFRYSGGTVEPLQSDVADYVFTDVSRGKLSEAWAVTNALFGEVWWFYTSGDSTVIDRYVAYNYRENNWSTGSLTRTAGIDQGAWRFPMWVDGAGVVYEQEYAFNHGDDVAFVESGPIMLGAGDNVMSCTYLYPDEETRGEVQATFKTRFYPNGEERVYGPYSMDTPTSLRFTGRQVRMRLESTGPSDWRVGIMRIDATPGGKR